MFGNIPGNASNRSMFVWDVNSAWLAPFNSSFYRYQIQWVYHAITERSDTYLLPIQEEYKCWCNANTILARHHSPHTNPHVYLDKRNTSSDFSSFGLLVCQTLECRFNHPTWTTSRRSEECHYGTMVLKYVVECRGIRAYMNRRGNGRSGLSRYRRRRGNIEIRSVERCLTGNSL